MIVEFLHNLIVAGDTVYVLRDMPNEETGSSTTPPSKHTYKTIKNIKFSDCDIFKIERLWKDEKWVVFELL